MLFGTLQAATAEETAQPQRATLAHFDPHWGKVRGEGLLPRHVRTDRAPPFSSAAVAERVSWLSLMLDKEVN